MPKNLYVAAAEPRSGKSLVVLGLMELLSRCERRIGFFRPVIRGDRPRDTAIELIATRYGLPFSAEAMYGCTYDEAVDLISGGRYQDLLKGVLDKYKALEEQCDVVLCLGTDFSGVTSALELEYNADLANNLGCVMIPVAQGRHRTTRDIVDGVQALLVSLETHGCELLAFMVNRVAPDHVSEVSEELRHVLPSGLPSFTIPEHPVLSRPTVREVASELGAQCISCMAGSVCRQVASTKVAAMELPHFLERIEEGNLIITPADRSDIVLGTVLADMSSTYPQPAGLILTGNLEVAPQVTRLLDGLPKSSLPVWSVATDTFTTAVNVSGIEGAITLDSERKIAAGLGIMEAHVDFGELERRIAVTYSPRVTPLMFEYKLIQEARKSRKHIVLPEGTEERILKAADILLLRDVVEITLLGDPEEVRQKATSLGLSLEGAHVTDPQTSPLREALARTYYDLRKHKGISEARAYDAMADCTYFGTMMVHHGHVDGLVSGAVHTTQETLRPAFEIIRVKPGFSLASSVFFMLMKDCVLVFGDCAVNPDPDAQELAEIAVTSADTAELFGVLPRVAMLSYSTGESGKGVDVDKVREATKIARKLRPDLEIEGPIQYDAAVDPETARIKMPDSKVAGRATVFVFPDLSDGNITYKAVQRSAKAVAVGPVIQGLNKPVNDLSRGATVTDIVNTIAITAIQAQTNHRDTETQRRKEN